MRPTFVREVICSRALPQQVLIVQSLIHLLTAFSQMVVGLNHWPCSHSASALTSKMCVWTCECVCVWETVDSTAAHTHTHKHTEAVTAPPCVWRGYLCTCVLSNPRPRFTLIKAGHVVRCGQVWSGWRWSRLQSRWEIDDAAAPALLKHQPYWSTCLTAAFVCWTNTAGSVWFVQHVNPASPVLWFSQGSLEIINRHGKKRLFSGEFSSSFSNVFSLPVKRNSSRLYLLCVGVVAS